jgi:uncharacterized protein YbcI
MFLLSHSGRSYTRPPMMAWWPRPRTKPRISAESRLILARAKVERAKENLRDMERLFAKDGYFPGINMHVRARKQLLGAFLTYHIRLLTLASAGDVVVNLRGALDHLAYQLTKVHRPRITLKQERDISFPICKDQTAYEKTRKAVEKLLGPEAIKLIDALKPYKGGNEALFRLNELNNINKHKLLPTVERYVICNDAWIGKPFMYKFGRPQFSGIFARPKVKDYILRGGKETITKLRSGRREALLPTLHYLVEVVDRIVNEFLPVLE